MNAEEFFKAEWGDEYYYVEFSKIGKKESLVMLMSDLFGTMENYAHYKKQQ